MIRLFLSLMFFIRGLRGRKGGNTHEHTTHNLNETLWKDFCTRHTEISMAVTFHAQK